jgi:RHS repeat-associated protein
MCIDYYPFGMPMPNKQTTDGNYRYAFQGQEKDPETGMEAFELRLWDGRLGRWLTVDPKHEFFSPYIGMGNNPVSLIDPEGGSTIDPKNGIPAILSGNYQDPSSTSPVMGPQNSIFANPIEIQEVVISAHRNRINTFNLDLSFGSSANEAVVTDYTRSVLQDLARESGVRSLTITSTQRTPEDQARAMFNNIVSNGIAHQKRLYGPAGDKVIDTYSSTMLKGGTASKIKEAMANRIRSIGPSKVSRHCGDPNILNVIDISPRSISRKTQFINAVNHSGNVSKFLQPPSDPAYHLEIPQN